MLVGIAKLAAESQPLGSKRKVEYFELAARSLLNRTKPGMPFEWAINPYRGCEFGCRYCYARYTHEFMGMEDSRQFEEKIYAKAHTAELLRRELRRVGPKDWIAIGTATDPYQPAERRFGKTRAILEVFAEGRGRRLSSESARPAAGIRQTHNRMNVIAVASPHGGGEKAATLRSHLARLARWEVLILPIRN